jgi:hypothetical protein
MNIQDFNKLIIAAHTGNTLITSKHNPNQICNFYKNRSVVAHAVVENFIPFIQGGKYKVKLYHNNNYPKSPLYWTITPNPDSEILIVASGLTGNTPKTALDTLVVVSGSSQGLHMYGTSSGDIWKRVSDQRLIFKYELEPN